jgi:glycosyltransferase involved in cell wall biosynthesis
VADFFMLASRLDPMPNVTIDAAHRGIPVICFNEASGMADVLKSDPITAGCVVDYLDAAMAADAILSLGRDRDALRSVAAATQRLATEVFDMTRYVDALDRLGSNAATSPASGQTPAPLPAYPANS